MADPTQVDPIKERLLHPIIGPFIWSFFVANWEITINLLGAVGHPNEALTSIGTYLGAYTPVSFWRLVPVLVFPPLYIWGAPKLALFYYRYELMIAGKRREAKTKADKLASIPRATFDGTILDLQIHEERQNHIVADFGALRTNLDTFATDLNNFFSLYGSNDRMTALRQQLSTISVVVNQIALTAKNTPVSAAKHVETADRTRILD